MSFFSKFCNYLTMRSFRLFASSERIQLPLLNVRFRFLNLYSHAGCYVLRFFISFCYIFLHLLKKQSEQQKNHKWLVILSLFIFQKKFNTLISVERHVCVREIETLIVLHNSDFGRRSYSSPIQNIWVIREWIVCTIVSTIVHERTWREAFQMTMECFFIYLGFVGSLRFNCSITNTSKE